MIPFHFQEVQPGWRLDRYIVSAAVKARWVARLDHCCHPANGGRILTHEHLLRRVCDQYGSGDSGPVQAIVRRPRRNLGRRRGRPRPHLQREARGLLHGKGRGIGRAGVTMGQYQIQRQLLGNFSFEGGQPNSRGSCPLAANNPFQGLSTPWDSSTLTARRMLTNCRPNAVGHPREIEHLS